MPAGLQPQDEVASPHAGPYRRSAMSPPTEPNTIYVVGNGPSLRGFDFAQLAGSRWIGMNAAYRHWARTGLYPTHYACLDRVVGLSHADAIADMVTRAGELGIECFLLDDAVADAVSAVHPSDRILRASALGWGEGLTARVTTGSHAVLWAAHMGCDAVHLHGIDQNYVEEVPGLQPSDDGALEVAEEARSPNYYFEDYQRVGDRLNRPNPVPHVHATAWRRVMAHMRRVHPQMRVVNHSPVSDIPGTAPPRSDAPRRAAAADASVTVPDGARWRDILPGILPRRFTSLSLEPGLHAHGVTARDFGAGWQRISPERAPHDGRWHLHVQSASSDPAEPELGSVLFLPPAGAEAEWHPDGARWFDRTIRFVRPDRKPAGLLALRVDDGAPLTETAPRAGALRRAIVSTERVARRALRRLRSARSR